MNAYLRILGLIAIGWALMGAGDSSVTPDESSQSDDGPACAEGAPGPAIKLKIDGFRKHEGNIRVQLYSDNPEEYLAKGKRLRRIVMPVPEKGAMEVCMAIETPGEYALIVIHDRDADGKADPFSEGFGLPSNEGMKLRKPKYEEGRFVVGAEVMEMPIDLNYLGGNKKRRGRR